MTSDRVPAAAASPRAAHSASPAGARTWLFAPGNRPERFDKARFSSADEIILDLEDAVAPDAKEKARRDVAWWLTHGGSGWVRINAIDTDYHDRDVSMLGSLPGLRGFIVAKAEMPAALRSLGRRLEHRGLIALVESARGVHRAFDIAECDAVQRLAFGSIDFAQDIDAAESSDSLLLARATLVLASRVAGKPAPIDGVTTAVRDPAAVAEAAAYARSLGFGGKLCIQPDQLAVAAAAFAPSAEQVQWAREVLDAIDATPVSAS